MDWAFWRKKYKICAARTASTGVRCAHHRFFVKKQQVKELQSQLNEIYSSDLESRLEGGSKYCFTPECIAASNNLFQWMNKEADPCEDFNQFACGNFIKTSIIPDDKKRWTASDPLEDIGKKENIILSIFHWKRICIYSYNWCNIIVWIFLQFINVAEYF